MSQLNKEIDQANYDLARLLNKEGYRSIALPMTVLPVMAGYTEIGTITKSP